MTTIWKFPIEVTREQEVEMPAGAELLAVQMQGDQPCVWAAVDPEAPKHPRRLRIYGTGHPILRDSLTKRYIGTFQQGPFVWHLFDLGPHYALKERA